MSEVFNLLCCVKFKKKKGMFFQAETINVAVQFNSGLCVSIQLSLQFCFLQRQLLYISTEIKAHAYVTNPVE